MSFPDIHKCMKLSSENIDLKRKYLKVKEQRDTYHKELQVFKQKENIDNLLKSYVTTRNTSCQTEPGRSWQPICFQKKKSEEAKENDADKTNKLLSMHNQMMRRYEKEVKLNMSHMETITDLNIQLSELERKLIDKSEKHKKTQKELLDLHVGKHKKMAQKKEDTEDKYSHIKNECVKVKKENEKLKKELKGLDLGFFEEIEDIKFALQQSAKLNKEYEQTLRKMCVKFGIPYPHPEKNILGDRSKWK
ncbi:centrosomal protein of 290 kDa-like isoform X1 [Mytilus edulis]|uniref:centrosomal protein of 290 kDa-like isoform X1 n=1 Tax=Mytilus edulis TaxID=6550 RepID=UPI0039EEE630